MTEQHCVGCNHGKLITRKTAVCYKIDGTYDLWHWNCFLGTFSNTHDNTYNAVIMRHTNDNTVIQWNDLPPNKQKSARALLTKTKMYGDLEQHTGIIHISGMCAQAYGFSPDDAKKIIEEHKQKTLTKQQKIFKERKEKWLKKEKYYNIIRLIMNIHL